MEPFFRIARAIPFWLSIEGFIEMRAYRELGTGWVLAEMEFDSFESWGKALDTEKCKEIMRKIASYTNSTSWKLYAKSPFAPEPLKPKK